MTYPQCKSALHCHKVTEWTIQLAEMMKRVHDID